MKKLVLSLILFAATGQGAELPTPARPEAVVGIMMLIDEQARHVHVGTTRFQNFEREAVSDWQFPAALSDQIRTKLVTASRPEVIRIEATPALMATRLNQLKSGRSTVKLRDNVAAQFEEAIAGKGLDYLVTVEPYETNLTPQLSVPAQGYGVFTVCPLMQGCQILPMSHVGVSVYSTNPVRLLATAGALSDRNPLAVTMGKDEVKTLTAAQIDPARERVLAKVSVALNRTLREAGLTE
jgi:hypothetical protein